MEHEILKQPNDYERNFDPHAYLEHFYSRAAVGDGLKTALFALPLYLRRIALTCYATGRFTRLLDVGAGPTIYSAVCAREFADEIYLSDYADTSLYELRAWLANTSTFDWHAVVRSVAVNEGCTDDVTIIERQARARVRGIWHCDVHKETVVDDAACTLDTRALFDVVVSIFCLESACTTLVEYAAAMRNIVSRIRPGGHLIFGSVLEDTLYTFGVHKYHLLYLTRQNILDAMTTAGLDTAADAYCSYEHDGAFMIMIQKK